MNFFVIETDPIVLLDMIAILRDRFPQANVEYSSTLTEARDRISRIKDLAATLVGVQLNDFLATDLPDLVERKRGKIIFAHYGVSDGFSTSVERGWTPLSVPFTNETLNDALMRSGFSKH